MYLLYVFLSKFEKFRFSHGIIYKIDVNQYRSIKIYNKKLKNKKKCVKNEKI
jgi:hypothetical protein